MRSWIAVALVLSTPAATIAAGNGKLQLHHIDVGQGDGLLLISPQGETALFDDGTYTNCGAIVGYLQDLGVTSLGYHFCTHYHADHIGCLDDLATVNITVTDTGYDRGGSYSSATFTDYVNTLGSKRATISKNQTITLDAGQANPVVVKCVDLNGAGVYSGTDENALSVVYRVTYGAFDEVVGGDLTGGSGNDVESTVGPEVGDVEIYKVHHHGSSTSSNDAWLTAVVAEVGIISVGNNSYGHPTSAALTRLHNHNVHTYWTETGSGVAPNPSWDQVGGTIVVQADPGAGAAYTVAGSGFTDTWYNGGGGPMADTKVASSVTMITGTVTSGDVTRLAADDGSRMTVTAGHPSTYQTDWYGSATLDHSPTQLTVTYDGNYSISRTQKLFLYNFSSGAWDQIDSYSVGKTDRTRTWTTTSPANYVSGSREVRLRVQANTRTSSYTCRADYMAFTYEYTGGAPRIVPETPVPAWSPDEAAIRLLAAPNPACVSTELQFALPEEADARLDVFDAGGRSVATPFAGRAAAGWTRAVWSFSGPNGSRVPAGVYFARLSVGPQTAVTRLIVIRR